MFGCGEGRPERVRISGQVLIDGQPLTHGYVRFVPTDARASRGELDSNGRFELGCFEAGDGAVPGTHRVEISGMQRLSDWETRWHAPKKYADYKTSEVTREINGPTEAMLIELTWDGGKPFTEVDESARPSAVDRRSGRGHK
jgi:hypothetical protein